MILLAVKMATVISPVKCQLSEWGLPPLIIAWFRKKGITSLFEWQVECLCKGNVLCGENLVYSAPTSAGKTMVADILLIKRVLEYNKKALVIEPYVALTREKAATLKSMLKTTNARVGAFGGTYYVPGGMASVKVAICTIEKANNFINKLINESKLSDLGIIVVDEIHHLGDDKRGYQLELLLTKVLYYNSQQEMNRRIQIVGLSATIPNLQSISTWLSGSLYVTDYRPVPLIEKIKIGKNIYEVGSYMKNPGQAQPLEKIDNNKIYVEKDFDDLCYICIDTIVSGHSCLVFCESKRECEILAANLAEQLKLAGNKLKSDNQNMASVASKLRTYLVGEKIRAVLEKLKKCPAGVDKELVKSLYFGVAFHHAGLTSEEREIIEDGFKSGAIKALMATSTLSSGVNLPARRVIIRSPTMVYSTNGVYQKEMLNPTTYRQMIGRAGRKNIDSCGESILICRPDNHKFAIDLIKSSLGNIKSSLIYRMLAAEGEPTGLKKAILEVIANNTAKTRTHLNQYLKSTFWLSNTSKEEADEFMRAVVETLRYLVRHKFIEELKPGVYKATRLGNAVLASGLHPDESLELLQDLLKARQGFCLLNDLHIIYQVTPNDIARSIELKDWQHYSKIWNELDETCRYVGEKIGIEEFTLARRCQGFLSAIGEDKERLYKRFWVALVINDLIQEIPLPKICDKYRMSKAVVQQAQRAVAQFAGVMSIFCDELGYDNIAALVTPLESRINFSCQRDLLELIRLNLTRPIARALFNAGYKNPLILAKADKLDIEFILRQMKPFKKDQSFNIETDPCPSMWVPEMAKSMTTLDYASHIVDTAKQYVQVEFEIADTLVETIKRKDVPIYILKYVSEREVKEFMDKWILHSEICLNFKLLKQINKSIGSDIKRLCRSECLQLDSGDANMPYSVTRLYASFDDDLTVYVLDTRDAMMYLRENLSKSLNNFYSSTVDFIPIKLYAQDIVLTYKILYLTFNMDQIVLNKYFQWHSFDTAWWMVNYCPNRGLNNRNSSLSLVAKTEWAAKYHHFLYPDTRTSKEAIRNQDEFLKLKDIVKAGKTAILKPLITELLDHLKTLNQHEAYFKAEVQSRLAMTQLMVHGIGLNMKSMREELNLYEDLSQQLTDIAQRYFAKSSISLTNPKDVARVLYEDLDLKKHLLNHSTVTSIHKDSTCAELLTILSEYHPFPKLVQDFRKIGKALDALQSANTHARFDDKLQMMRVFGRCDFWQVTGRIAMSDPDLFLINRNFTVSLPAHGSRPEERVECNPRRCFVPQKNWLMVSADYSQLELRLLAHFSSDENLLEILNRSPKSEENFDVFKTVASKIYRKSVEEITSENRQHTKQICYGIIYGMGNTSLANKLGVDIEQAEAFRQDFFAAFPRIRRYTEELVEDCQKKCYVESILGRRRYMDGIDSADSNIKSRAARVAVNTRIQSSASDLIKLAMQSVNQKILEHYVTSVRLILEMHDELIFEVDPTVLTRFSKTLKFSMERVDLTEELKVKLLVNLKKGTNWSNLEELKEETSTYETQNDCTN